MRRIVHTTVKVLAHAPVKHKVWVGVGTLAAWACAEYVFKAHEVSRVVEMLVGAPTFHRMYEGICERLEAGEREVRDGLHVVEGVASPIMQAARQDLDVDPFER